ncbi:MAG: family 20 glycosylhydrolase [FCB group bacterium]|nr:family 20 glycosylhydrolase [FCB group bacterium]
MKKYLAFLIVMFLFSCGTQKDRNGVINGIMIDCSRLLEKHEYYYKLVDFMADWDMNTLLLHFSDDHGLSIVIPGFEQLAHPRAFTPEEIQKLIAYAESKGIEIIPELEVFGHTRYITDHPDYHHLFLGDRTGSISFNALDPLNPESVALMRMMIAAVADMFPSRFFHLGCDEVNLSALNLPKEQEAQVWADYVNTMIAFAHEQGKMPMIWNDHLQKNDAIAGALRKDVMLVEWNYVPDYKPRNLARFQEMGYPSLIMAPSISCYLLRVLPSRPGLMNTEAMTASVRDGTADGLINTIWLPMRYIQNAMWYGIAYSAFLVNNNRDMDVHAFHQTFARKVFGAPLTKGLEYYLNRWPDLHLDYRFYINLANGMIDYSGRPDKMEELRAVYLLSSQLIEQRPYFKPRKNEEILKAIYLTTDVMHVLSNGLLILSKEPRTEEEVNGWKEKLAFVIEAVDAEWDRGRYPDDPAKYKAKFPNQSHSHLLIMLKKLSDLGEGI